MSIEVKAVAGSIAAFTAASGIGRSFGLEPERQSTPRMRGYIGVYTLKKEPLSRALIRSQLVPESN